MINCAEFWYKYKAQTQNAFELWESCALNDGIQLHSGDCCHLDVDWRREEEQKAKLSS